MARLTGEQKANVKKALRIANRLGAPPRAKKALVEAMGVESNYRDLRHGHADSQGILQLRTGIHGTKNAQSVERSVRLFLTKGFTGRGGAIALAKKGMDPGSIAQAVQGSAFPAKYGQRASEADQILRSLDTGGGGGGSRGSRGGGRGTRTSSRTRPQYGMTEPIDNSALRQDAKLAYLQERGKPGALLSLSQSLKAAEDVPAQRVQTGTETVRTVTRGRGGRNGGGGGGVSGSGKPTKGGKLIGTPHSGTHTLGNWESDNAVDISTKDGDRIFAVGDGVVESVKGSYNGGASRFDGYQVKIRTRNNRIFYTHLSRASVKKGQRVKRGQTIGRAGSANGVPHLHMGVEKGDPRQYVK